MILLRLAAFTGVLPALVYGIGALFRKPNATDEATRAAIGMSIALELMVLACATMLR